VAVFAHSGNTKKSDCELYSTFYPENGGNMFLKNNGNHLQNYMTYNPEHIILDP
jgi:hypothetical protein